MDEKGVELTALSETRWTGGSGIVKVRNKNVLYSGSTDKHIDCIGIALTSYAFCSCKAAGNIFLPVLFR